MPASGQSHSGGFSLETELVEALPILCHYSRRIGLDTFFEKAVSTGDGRTRLSPAKALRVTTTNICVHHEPVYALGEWAARRDPALLGLEDTDVAYLNDDRVGRALARLFDADRASLLGELVLRAVAEFEVDCSRLHNDSTSVKLQGVYASATGGRRGTKKTVTAAYGFSKVCVLHCASFHLGVSNSPTWGRCTWMRSPCRLPRRTCTAARSPRWTRCNTVWRATRRIEAASSRPTQPSGTSSATLARSSSVSRMRHGASGSGRSATMKPSRIQR